MVLGDTHCSPVELQSVPCFQIWQQWDCCQRFYCRECSKATSQQYWQILSPNHILLEYPFLFRNVSVLLPPGDWMGMWVQSMKRTTPGICPIPMNALCCRNISFPVGEMIYRCRKPSITLDTFLQIKLTVNSCISNVSPKISRINRLHKIGMQPVAVNVEECVSSWADFC